MTTLFDQKRAFDIYVNNRVRDASEEAEARDVERGMEKGMHNAFFGLVRDGLLPLKEAARRTNMTEAAFMEAMKKRLPTV